MPCIHLDTREKQMVSFMLQLLYPQGKTPLVPIRPKAAWTPEPIWTWWQAEKSLPLPE